MGVGVIVPTMDVLIGLFDDMVVCIVFGDYRFLTSRPSKDPHTKSGGYIGSRNFRIT